MWHSCIVILCIVFSSVFVNFLAWRECTDMKLLGPNCTYLMHLSGIIVYEEAAMYE
jgi:hypothetical protein